MERGQRVCGAFAFLLTAGLLVLGSCSKKDEPAPTAAATVTSPAPGPTPALGSGVLRDSVSGFLVTKPNNWFVQTGDELREQALKEAARARDLSMAPPPRGGSHEVFARMTRFAPDKTPGNNPTIVFTRFDLQQLPPGTTAEKLIQAGTLTAHVEEGVRVVQLGGRPWDAMTVSRVMQDGAGQDKNIVQHVYVTTGDRWAIAITISTVGQDYAENQPAFDSLLRSIQFEDNASH
jgi:hypothetical protein